MRAQHVEHRTYRIARVHRPGVAQALADMGQESIGIALRRRLGLGLVAVVVGAAHHQWQLRAKMGGKRAGHAVAQRAQHGAQHVPGDLPVGADVGHHLIQPDVRGLQRLVEDVQAGGAHGSPPSLGLSGQPGARRSRAAGGSPARSACG